MNLQKEGNFMPDFPIEFSVHLKNSVLKSYRLSIPDFSECKLLSNPINKSGFDDFCFSYKNAVFSVIIDIRDSQGHSYITDNRKMFQIMNCRKFNMIPCLYPVSFNNPYEIDIMNIPLKNIGWNLVHTLTKQNIIPQNFVSAKLVKMSEWELFNSAVLYLVNNLQGQGCQVLSMQFLNYALPHVWFIDKSGKKSWCVVNLVASGINRLDADNLNKIAGNNCYNNGFVATVEMQGQFKEGCFRDENIIPKIVGFEKIYSVDEFFDNKISNILSCDILKLLVTTFVRETPMFLADKLSVYKIPDNPNLLLKISNTNKKNLLYTQNNFKLCKIKYEESVIENEHFGLPLYLITNKDEPEFVSPDVSVLFERNLEDILIIRKIDGVDVMQFYFDNYVKLLGKNMRDNGYTLFVNLVQILLNYGNEAFKKGLDLCKQGVLNVEENQVAENSPAYKFYDSKTFFSNYTAFVESYLSWLKVLSDLPVASFRIAINDILSVKDFIFDFSHPANTFLDLDTKTFKFIDFIFEKVEINKKKIEYGNIVKVFRDVLLGKNFSSELIYPYQILVYKNDLKLFKKYAKIITQKINSVSPKNMQIDNDYVIIKM